MPSCSSERPISRSLNNIPLEFTPRILDFFSVRSVPGIYMPLPANTPFIPARAFGAPHTTSTISLPLLTWQTCNRSALGCFSAFSTCATTNSFRRSAGSSRFSNSRPIIVSLSAISRGEALVSSSCSNHFMENFIWKLSLQL